MGDVKVTVSADTAGVNTGLARAQEAVNSFKEASKDAIKDVGEEMTKAFAAGAVIEGVKGIGEEMERVQKLSIRFGESAETIQRVSEAAKLNGTDLEAVAKAMTKVNSTAVDATEGNDKLNDAFTSLGINAKDFVGLPLEEKLLRLSDGYEKGQGNAEQMAAVMKVLGKGAADLIPMLAQGSDALSEQFANASVVSNAAVNQIAEANETLTHSFDTLKTWAAEALGAVAGWAHALGQGLAVISAYVTTLPQGFKAAKEAADEAAQAAHDLDREEDAARQKEMDKAKENTGVGDVLAAKSDQASQEDDLQKLRDENAKKEQEAHLRSITLVQREIEIKEQLRKLEGDLLEAKINHDEKGSLTAENAKLDLEKELGEVEEKQATKDKEAAEQLARQKKQATEKQIKDEEEANHKQLEAAENKLQDLEKKTARSYTVDSLRSIGGGLAGANYSSAGNKESLAHQQIALQKETVEQLKKVAEALKDKQRLFDNDGSFTL